VRLLDVRGWPIGVRVMIVSRSKVGRCVLTQFIDFTQISQAIQRAIERIKRKLGAVNRSDLFEIAVARGYYALIPSHVFDEPTTIRLR